MGNKTNGSSSKTFSIIVLCVVTIPTFLFWLLGPMGLNLLAKIESNSVPKDNISDVINWFRKYGVVLENTVSRSDIEPIFGAFQKAILIGPLVYMASIILSIFNRRVSYSHKLQWLFGIIFIVLDGIFYYLYVKELNAHLENTLLNTSLDDITKAVYTAMFYISPILYYFYYLFIFTMLRKLPYIGGVKLWKRIGSLTLLIGGYFLGNIIIPNIFELGAKIISAIIVIFGILFVVSAILPQKMGWIKDDEGHTYMYTNDYGHVKIDDLDGHVYEDYIDDDYK